jgi:L-fuculose-phosphate aldolase
MTTAIRPTTKATETDARQSVIETAREMSRLGLSPGRSGNVSRRWRDGMLITPSGMAYDAIVARDIVFVDGDGMTAKSSRRPSSEWRFHTVVYHTRLDRHAIVHSHSLNATALACAHKAIPAFHYMVAAAGGADIPCVPYATFGTEALSQNVVGGLRDRDACLMANHGQIAIGETLSAALELAALIEVLSEQYCKVLALGKPNILDAAEMARVVEKFKGYGQKAQG